MIVKYIRLYTNIEVCFNMCFISLFYNKCSYDSNSLGLEPGGDYATMNAEMNVGIGMATPWKNSKAYDHLIKLGGRPFIASTGKQGTKKFFLL